MNIAPRYLGRGSWLSRRDPRVLVLVVVLFIFTVVQVWDGRVVAGLFLLALLYYRAASIPFRQVRRNWIFAVSFVTLVVLLNTVLTGNRLEGMEIHPYFTWPLVGTVVSAESITYAMSQWMRYMAMVTVGFPVAFCVRPSDFGVTFARLGVPDKFAFAVDLTFRFLPSLGNDYQQTIDAQRIRGYDPSGARGLFARLRHIAPVLTPVTMNAISGAEDTIDAMDLRGFGTGKRTWLRELRFDRTDKVIVAFFTLLLVAATIAGFTTATSRIWVPPFMLPS